MVFFFVAMETSLKCEAGIYLKHSPTGGACSLWSWETLEMQSPKGSRLRGFYFRLHPLMPGERGCENTSVESVIHYCDRWIVFIRQDAGGGIFCGILFPKTQPFGPMFIGF